MIAIKTLRKKANLTQKNIANEIKVDRSTIAKWESGEALPRSDNCLLYKSRCV